MRRPKLSATAPRSGGLKRIARPGASIVRVAARSGALPADSIAKLRVSGKKSEMPRPTTNSPASTTAGMPAPQ
jgi:hypothetical protein